MNVVSTSYGKVSGILVVSNLEADITGSGREPTFLKEVLKIFGDTATCFSLKTRIIYGIEDCLNLESYIARLAESNGLNTVEFAGFDQLQEYRLALDSFISKTAEELLDYSSTLELLRKMQAALSMVHDDIDVGTLEKGVDFHKIMGRLGPDQKKYLKGESISDETAAFAFRLIWTFEKTSSAIALEMTKPVAQEQLSQAIVSHDCIATLKVPRLKAQSVYTRDMFIPYTDNVIVPRFSRVASYYSHLSKLLNRARRKCRYKASIYPKLDIQGGNMFVVKDLVIVGLDEFYVKYRNVKKKSVCNRLKELHRPYTLGSNPRLQELLTWVQLRLGEKLGHKKVFWLGLHSKVVCPVQLGSHWQPLYHLDLFFNAVKLIDHKNGTSSLVCIIGTPSKAHLICLDGHDRTLWLVNINERIDNAIKTLESQLPKKIKMKRVNLPLRVIFNEQGKLDHWSPFTNGIVEIGDSKSRYVLPARKKWDKSEHVDLIVKQLKTEAGFTDVIPLWNAYEKEASLRCRVLPFSREEF